MTSNTTPSGTVTSSGSSYYAPWNAFDRTNATLWLSTENTTSVWIAYDWATPRLVKTYQIAYANGDCCQERGPRDWTLQGWTGVAWMTLDTVTGQSGWYGNPTRTYTVDNPGSYSKYRLNITADNYNSATYPITMVSIAEIQMYGEKVSALVPAMTSATSLSGSVTQSGFEIAHDGWQAFDRTLATAWFSNGNASTVWIGYAWRAGTENAVSSYDIKYSHGSCCEGAGPKDWALQGWDGFNWVTVDSVTNQTGWYANPYRSFGVDNPGCYSQYRLNITADNYNNPVYPVTFVSISEIQLFGTEPK